MARKPQAKTERPAAPVHETITPIIVYGPKGCGKTRFIAEIAHIFGMAYGDVIDDWIPGEEPLEPGKIHIMTGTPPGIVTGLKCHAIWIDVRSLRLSPIPGGSIPAANPFTCGTGHLQAQATLTLLNRLMVAGGHTIDADLVETMNHLVNEAGWKFAADMIQQPADDGDDIPF